MSIGGVLTGPEICKEVAAGAITIDPWEPELVGEGPFEWANHAMVNSGSYDLRLGSKVAVYKRAVYFIDDGQAYMPYREPVVRGPEYFRHRLPDGPVFDYSKVRTGSELYFAPDYVLDSRKKQEIIEFEMDRERGWLVKPGIGYLMHTSARILTRRYIPIIEGKSSIGRLFVTAHVTAGYGDAGFNGQYTLEVTATHPVILYPGMRFCQVRFLTQVGEVLDYAKKGHYVDEASMGPVASMSWKQFEEDV